MYGEEINNRITSSSTTDSSEPVITGRSRTHHLKTETEYYQATERGEKLFEIRKDDLDFRFQKGDVVFLLEVVNGIPTGRKLGLKITYVFQGGRYGIADNYCILQLKKISP